MKAGVACLDITPPLGARIPGYFEDRWAAAIHDPLHVRAFVVEGQGKPVAIAICDLIGVRRIVLDRAKARIADATGLLPDQVLIACTHTHTGAATGDDPYTEFLTRRIADAVIMAWRSRRPAEAGWGRAIQDAIGFNRRYRMRDGSVQTNPGIGNPDVVEPAGPVDPDVGVFCVATPEGEPLGLLANFALHYIGIPDDSNTISADYFGAFSESIQRLRGKRFVAALCNGASGDINNGDVIGGARPENTRYQHLERVGARVAAAAFWAWGEMSFCGDLRTGAAMAEIVLRPRPAFTDADRERAREIQTRMDDHRPVRMDERSFALQVLQGWGRPRAEVETCVQALQIGDLAIVGVPGELFCELGLEIKRRSPFAQTMIIELANDTVGYLPSRQAYQEGGYESTTSPYLPGVGEQVTETALDLLTKMRDE